MARRGENIHKRNDGRWEGRYIKARTPDRRICWGYIYGTTYAEVKQRLIHKKSEYGGFQLIDAHLTFTELAEAWLQSVKCGLKESTCAHYQYTLYKYVLPILGTVPISRLEENILEQALQKIIAPPDGQHKELGFSSARECLSMVRRICKYAVHLRLIRPMELSVRLPQEKSHSMTPLSVVEQNRLRTYVLSNPTPRKLGLLLGIESGLRIGEVCGLKWDDFDLKTGTVQIKRAVSRIPCGDGHMPRVRLQDEGGRTVQRYVKDYRITQDMAKKLCKLHHTAVGAAYRPQPFDWDVLLGLLHKKPPRRSSYEAQLSDSDSLVTTTQIAKEYGCGAKVFNRLLHLHGIQYRVNGQWVLYSEHHGKGYTSSLTFRLQRSDGSEVEKLHTAWTQKGRKFLYHTLKRRGVLPLAEQGG